MFGIKSVVLQPNKRSVILDGESQREGKPGQEVLGILKILRWERGQSTGFKESSFRGRVATKPELWTARSSFPGSGPHLGGGGMKGRGAFV